MLVAAETFWLIQALKLNVGSTPSLHLMTQSSLMGLLPSGQNVQIYFIKTDFEHLLGLQAKDWMDLPNSKLLLRPPNHNVTPAVTNLLPMPAALMVLVVKEKDAVLLHLDPLRSLSPLLTILQILAVIFHVVGLLKLLLAIMWL